MSYDLCSGCKIGGPTFKVIPGYLAQVEAEWGGGGYKDLNPLTA